MDHSWRCIVCLEYITSSVNKELFRCKTESCPISLRVQMKKYFLPEKYAIGDIIEDKDVSLLKKLGLMYKKPSQFICPTLTLDKCLIKVYSVSSV
jgi:hypothetical protein